MILEGEIMPAAKPSQKLNFKIPPPSDIPATVKLILDGLPVEYFSALSKKAGMSEKNMASRVGISTATIARRKKSGVFARDESERVMRFMRVVERCEELFGGDELGAQRWLNTPDDLFEGRTPFEYAETEPGAQYVMQIIGRLEHGVYS
jgi:putative toxin-antitoxin system antitoxin component (TIGR02293 family)